MPAVSSADLRDGNDRTLSRIKGNARKPNNAPAIAPNKLNTANPSRVGNAGFPASCHGASSPKTIHEQAPPAELPAIASVDVTNGRNCHLPCVLSAIVRYSRFHRLAQQPLDRPRFARQSSRYGWGRLERPVRALPGASAFRSVGAENSPRRADSRPLAPLWAALGDAFKIDLTAAVKEVRGCQKSAACAGSGRTWPRELGDGRGTEFLGVRVPFFSAPKKPKKLVTPKTGQEATRPTVQEACAGAGWPKRGGRA